MKSNRQLLVEGAIIIACSLAFVFFLQFVPEPVTKQASIADSGDVSAVLSKKGDTQKSEQAERPQAVAEKSFPGFTLYPTSGSAEVLLVNMNGETVHSWAIDADRARLLPSCELLVVHGTKWGIENEPWASMRPTIKKYSWTGEVTWEYTLPNAAHHDIQQLDNGNILALYLTDVPGYLTNKLKDPKLRGITIRSDVIAEITPDKKIVWSWAAHEHLDLNSCGPRSCEELRSRKIAGKRRLDWTHMNTISVLPENRWYDAGDERFRPGNILAFARNWWTAMIIDKETKKVVWRYRGDYKGGIVGGHEPYMIPKGIPGAGNILLFDNGRIARESHVLEVNPTTKKVVWVYDKGKAFYSVVAGAAQRLKNGNTLISEDVNGLVFEVTPEKETVWRYKGRDMRINRANRYNVNHCDKLEGLALN